MLGYEGIRAGVRWVLVLGYEGISAGVRGYEMEGMSDGIRLYECGN